MFNFNFQIVEAEIEANKNHERNLIERITSLEFQNLQYIEQINKLKIEIEKSQNNLELAKDHFDAQEKKYLETR